MMQATTLGGPVILASKSPRRKELLSRILDDFSTITIEVNEAIAHEFGSSELALQNARLKASVVAEVHPDSWVVGSDTVVSCDGESLGKPISKTEAFQMIRRLSGRSHEVYSGVSLINKNKGVEENFVEKSQVRFFTLTHTQIQLYVDTIDTTEFAGAYPIQHVMGSIVSGFDGSYTNIVGLPIDQLQEVMRHNGLLQ